MIPTPKVDWLALSPTLALLGASGLALLGSVLVPVVDAPRLRGVRRRSPASSPPASSPAIVFDESAEGRSR